MVSEVVRWDSFLADSARPQVEGFRQSNWKSIQHELRKLNINLGAEPCWVTPGRAVFWQQQIVRVPIARIDEDGREYRVLEDEDRGYAPTMPQPADSANAIAYHLRKGLLLRPPGQEAVEIEDEAPQTEAAEPDVAYKCYRHGTKRKSCPTWKGYVKHCQYYHEVIEYDPPASVLERAKSFLFYCFYHDKGFNNETGAKRHRTVELKRPGKAFHISLEEMKVQNG